MKDIEAEKNLDKPGIPDVLSDYVEECDNPDGNTGGFSYRLTNDVTLDRPCELTGNLSLDLNGHSIAGQDIDYVILVSENCTFNLYDSESKGVITGGKIGVYLKGSNSIFNMHSGHIEKNSNFKDDFESSGSDSGGGVHVAEGATFNMYGGYISNNHSGTSGGGVFVYTDAKFNMSGGYICNNSAIGYGGGVFVMYNGNFTMTNGEISGNSVNKDTHEGGGAGIGALLGNVDIKGGTITGNKATDTPGGGIYSYCSTIKFGDGKIIISGNFDANSDRSNLLAQEGSINITGEMNTESLIGVKILDANGYVYTSNSFTSDWGSTGNTNSKIFYSDDSDYAVGAIEIGGNKELILHTPVFFYRVSDENKNTLTEGCRSCDDVNTLTISAPEGTDENGNIAETGNPLEIEIKNDLLNSEIKIDKEKNVTYQKKNLSGDYVKMATGEKPTEPGTYKATLVVDSGMEDTSNNLGDTLKYSISVEYTITAAHKHSYTLTYTSDSIRHWRKCTATSGICDEPKTGIENHSWKDGVCSVCGYECTHNNAASGTCTICGKSLDDDGNVKIATEKEESNYASATLASTLADVKQAVLTEDDKSAISEGKDINIWLELKNADSTVSATDITLTESVIPADYNLGATLT